MNRKLIIILIFLVAVAFGLTAYLSQKHKEPKPPSVSTEKVDTKNWLTYRNDEYEYEMKYPRDWTVNETKYYQDELEMWIKYISFKNGDYRLIFLLNKIDERFNMGRTGIGAGDFENTGIWDIEGIEVKMKELIYENKTREIFFSGRNNLYNLSGYLSYLGNAYDNNFNFDKTKLKTAEVIIKSFKFIK